jgi:hypothetical protein
MSKLDKATRCALSTAALFAVLSLPHTASAQGKGHGKGKHEGKEAKAEKRDHDDDHDGRRLVKSDAGTVVQPLIVTQRVQRIPPGLAKKRVTTPQAVMVTRDVLLNNGFVVTQVVPTGNSQVIYYRRGNNGNGRGLGPVQRIVVVPAGQTVQFQSVPQSLLATILNRLGMQ